MPDFKPLYRYSFEESQRLNEHEQWRDSFIENQRCRDFIDEQIRTNYDGFHLSGDVAKKAIEEFGHDRTQWVLANTIQQLKNDGRFNAQNQAWAQSVYIPRTQESKFKEQESTRYYMLDSHPGLVDMVARDALKLYAQLNLYDHRHRVVGDVHQQDFENKLLILRADVLKESCRTPENQLFLANTGGFGCKPNASGRAVMGEFLIDGEKARFNREDFVGIVDDRYLADWAQEKMQEMTSSDDQEAAEAPEIKMKGL